jgi:hypothetical protein
MSTMKKQLFATQPKNITYNQAKQAVKSYYGKKGALSPAELRKQVVNYCGRLGPIGSKMQAAVWSN